MPVNFQTVNKEVKRIGEEARSRNKLIEERRAKAQELLAHYAERLPELRDKVEQAARRDGKLRCAVPRNEALDASFPTPPLPEQARLIAADGSQIYASRHEAIEYSLVNVGAVQLSVGSSAAPQRSTSSELFYGLAPEAAVSQKRDLRERQELAELAKGAAPPVITLSDGPLELWGGQTEYAKALEQYLVSLERLRQAEATAAGYVDKPIGNLVVRSLEIASLGLEEMDKRPLQGVRDTALYGEILAPGERSAVFGMQSYSAGRYEGELALHFFYLNVGRAGRPWLARVEIPAWVAAEEKRLKDLHAVLVEQAAIMGVRPYPYILHRAHEEALVSYDEKRQVDAMLARELEVFAGESHKQASKALPTAKTRYSQ